MNADILIVTVLPEEYAAVLGELTDARPVQGTPDAPNICAWRVGTLARDGGGTYRVALALVGSAGNVNASQAIARSVERWEPRYALLVGIAGGLATAGCAVGDVVVSTEVVGYEYGKLDGGFLPRPHWTHQVDPGLRASAQGFAAANPGWWQGTPGQRSKVLFGTVASGDKVMDDPSAPMFAAVLQIWPKLHAVEMEGAGAAAAVDYLRAAGTRVGFLIVRGISDIPRPPAERTGENAQTTERDANKLGACKAAARFVARWIAADWPVTPLAGIPAEVEGVREHGPPVGDSTNKGLSPTRPEIAASAVAPDPPRVAAEPPRSATEAASDSLLLDLSATYKIQKMYRDSSGHVYRHDYLGVVRLANRGLHILRVWAIEVEFPSILVPPDKAGAARNGSARRRLTSDERGAPIYPGESAELVFTYTMNDDIYWNAHQLQKGPFQLRAFIDDKLVIQKSVPFKEMENF
jgi:nucleoside phosphorylase